MFREYAWLWLIVLLINGCATPRAPLEAPPVRFDRQMVALMTESTYEDAEFRRQSLLRREPLPSYANVMPIGELDQVNPSLSIVAMHLRACEVSSVITSGRADGTRYYVLLQRGGDNDTTCTKEEMTIGERLKKMDEIGGELLMGILLVGLAGFLIAAPFFINIF